MVSLGVALGFLFANISWQFPERGYCDLDDYFFAVGSDDKQSSVSIQLPVVPSPFALVPLSVFQRFVKIVPPQFPSPVLLYSSLTCRSPPSVPASV